MQMSIVTQQYDPKTGKAKGVYFRMQSGHFSESEFFMTREELTAFRNRIDKMLGLEWTLSEGWENRKRHIVMKGD